MVHKLYVLLRVRFEFDNQIQGLDAHVEVKAQFFQNSKGRNEFEA
jgi:hypothetical protein